MGSEHGFKRGIEHKDMIIREHISFLSYPHWPIASICCTADGYDKAVTAIWVFPFNLEIVNEELHITALGRTVPEVYKFKGVPIGEGLSHDRD